jgi:hypothetical protein
MALEQFTNGYALLIAVNENLLPRYALPTVARDAEALRDVLVHPQRCAYPAKNVRLLAGSEASRAGIRSGLEWLKARIAADRSGNATAVIFYSGHGAFIKDERSYYLLPFDLHEPVWDSLLRAEEIAAAVEQVKPRRLLAVLDCCHAGGMGIKGNGLGENGLVKAAAPAAARSVVALAQGQGRAVLSSSKAAESSYIRSDRRMSIFTYHLVEALTGHASPTGYAQPEGGCEVLVSDVMSYISRQVPESARREYGVSQTPVYEISGENFPVALLLGGEGRAKGQPLPNPLAPLPAAGATVYTGGGAFVGGGAQAGGDVNLGAKTVAGDEIRGSKYVMSGNFRGAALNIESQLTHVTQTILDGPAGSPNERADLIGLIAALEAELACLSAGRAAEAESLAARLLKVTQALEDRDGDLAAVGCDALKRAAERLGGESPALVATTRQIAAAIHRLAGI